MGRANELLVSELHGKYFQQCYRGNVFIASTTTSGIVIPIATTKTMAYTIWNPAGSGKLLVPIVTLIGWTATAAALGSIIWTATTNAGGTIGSTGPIVSFTSPATVINANLGSGKVSQMKFGNDGTTIVTTLASTFYRETGCTVLIVGTTVNATQQPGFIWRDDWDGTAVIPPGNAIHLMATTAIAITATVSTVFEEIPL